MQDPQRRPRRVEFILTASVGRSTMAVSTLTPVVQQAELSRMGESVTRLLRDLWRWASSMTPKGTWSASSST
jgi:hypothetical protein